MSYYSSIFFRHAPLFFLLLILSSKGLAFGVLMTTPEQRDTLDRTRVSVEYPLPKGASVARQILPSTLEFQGLVKRRKGPNSIWVNGELIQASYSEGFSTDPNKLVDNSVLLGSSVSTDTVMLKPGQGIMLLKGRVEGRIYESFKRENDMLSSPDIIGGSERPERQEKQSTDMTVLSASGRESLQSNP